MIRTLVVDSAGVARDLTVAALKYEADIDVIGVASQMRDAKKLLLECDVVLLRAAVPDKASLKLVSELHAAAPHIKLIVYGLKQSEASALAFVEAGARGFVFEEDSFVELVRNLVDVTADQARISAQMAAKLMVRIQELKTLTNKLDHVYQYSQRFDQLTAREQQVLQLIGLGKSNRMIAESLIVEPGTVKNHVHNILKKLEVNNRQDAAAFLVLR